MLLNRLRTLLLCAIFLLPFAGMANDRAEELRREMWNSPDEDFKRVAIPEKWKNKSAVIISQLHRFEYRKAVIVSVIRVNQYSHYRIKLNDQNSIQKYAEIAFATDEPGSNGRKVYVGFKVIKPDGREILVDPETAVKMERDGSSGAMAYRKIAIPNLEPGDILDYYICEESVVQRPSQIQFFDPIIYNLPQEYPVIKQKLQFKVERRCFINLRSLNGAPELKLVVDTENDEQYYSLEDGDREGISDIRWLYPNRELPTIKFRASYASNAGLRSVNVLLGEPGEVKSEVSSKEIADLTKSLTMFVQYTKDAWKHIKRRHKGVKDPFVISKEAYYYFRNQLLIDAEKATLSGEGLSSMNPIRFTDKFSDFLTYRKIPHDIIVGVGRDISDLDDIVIEHELKFFIRVKKGNQYLYFTAPDIFMTADFVAPSLLGTEAYAVEGLVSGFPVKRVVLPTSSAAENMTETELHVKSSDLTSATVAAKHTLRGVNKLYGQYEFLDVYDAIEEDNKKVKEFINFAGYGSIARKQWGVKRDAYMATRDKDRNERLKKSLKGNYGFDVKEVSNFKVTQTGRYDDQPELVYSLDFTTEELIKKAGPNYLVDIGKLIEQQVKVESDELNRDYGVYFDFPRSFKYKIVFEIPEGYEVQGIDNLNLKVENATGGFTSTAKIDGDKLVIETYKHYDVLTLPREEWPAVVDFLNAAHNFSGQKVLLRKKR